MLVFLLLDVFMRRNMLGVCLYSFFCDMCFMIASVCFEFLHIAYLTRRIPYVQYYLPFLYQLRGHSATKLGIDDIPFMIAGILGMHTILLPRFFYFINCRKLLFFSASAERKLDSNLGNRSVQNGHNFILILHLFRVRVSCA
ncbi:hypothetical protein ARMGADRAFT_625314 [Armillaria gallica]|uniref:Uncharacterized protein n=1 Tax=Armillaria gallica TaxID=47427 RepID=A0A2H3DPN9_ARMGA|nr:hypothetical protein ARMGADRAFT_625314 [Armillaria gallica]